MHHTVTLVIHGTFAKDGDWWRLGDGETFADHLEVALAKRGKPGTVWQPALDQGFVYKDFAWSGANRHGDRKAGGKKLAANLAALADKLGTSERQPLQVNFVAHSHGGNVVLESLRWLTSSVHPASIVFLGTPLIRFTPRFRPARLLSSYALLTLLLLFVLCIPGWLALQAFGVPMKWSLGELVFNSWKVAFVVFILGWLLDGLWALAGRGLMWRRQRRSGHAYGPKLPPEATLLTSRLDEADLLLHLGATPHQLYKDWVRRQPRWFRVLSRIFLRPSLVGLGLSLIELTLERFVLGFPWWRVPFFDHSMADLKKGPHYSKIRRVDVQDKLSPGVNALCTLNPSNVRPPSFKPPGPTSGDSGQQETFKALTEVWQRLEPQVKLRHSMYYESPEVIADIADVLVDSAAS